MSKSYGVGRKIIKILRLPVILCYKIRGLKISFTSSFPISTVFENVKCVSIGRHCNFDMRTIIRCFPKAEGRTELVIGDNFCGLNDLKILCCGRVEIGNNVTCAGECSMISYNHGMNPVPESYNDNPLVEGNINIGNGVWIGEKVCILPGVSIGDKVIIGAGSVVTKDIPPYSIAVGNPARIIKKYNFEQKQWISVK